MITSQTAPSTHIRAKRIAKNVIGVSIATITLMSAQAQAGAWVAEKGKGYSKVGYSVYDADDFFGEQEDFGEFEGDNVSYYGEYGLGNNWGVFGSVLYQSINQSTASALQTENDGFGDLDLGVKYQWRAKPFVLTTSFLVKLPYLYDEDDTLPLGNGQEDYEAKVLIGKSLNRYGYFGLELGYRLRSGVPSDEFRYLIEYGFSVNDKLYFRTKLDGTESANNADDVTTTAGNLSRTPEFNIGKLELTAGYNFGEVDQQGRRWGAEFTYTDDLFGDETLKGSGVQIAITRVY